jgi:hypothetical protein
MGKVKRAEIVNPARKIGRNDAIKKRYYCFHAALGAFLTPTSQGYDRWLEATNCSRNTQKYHRMIFRVFAGGPYSLSLSQDASF